MRKKTGAKGIKTGNKPGGPHFPEPGWWRKNWEFPIPWPDPDSWGKKRHIDRTVPQSDSFGNVRRPTWLQTGR